MNEFFNHCLPFIVSLMTFIWRNRSRMTNCSVLESFVFIPGAMATSGIWLLLHLISFFRTSSKSMKKRHINGPSRYMFLRKKMIIMRRHSCLLVHLSSVPLSYEGLCWSSPRQNPPLFSWWLPWSCFWHLTKRMVNIIHNMTYVSNHLQQS